ncbi:MAG: hypothetical protein A3F13_04605 [Gammaproteobacteria bacterium RIFCSPHIGHO2_12_FULL_40_19]|nr:MAG: hypothetical protein A3F13_04605 [Gammaproteobacteria bacterium RIFCSPHIGHO2_12_FULL_40_19]
MRDEEQQITHHFTNIQALNNAYMPFVRDGGIFIPTENEFHLGNLVSATITLPENQQTFVFTGEVIWITPKSTQSDLHSPGIGIQCIGDEGVAFQKAVQALLADNKEDSNSDTM